MLFVQTGNIRERNTIKVKDKFSFAIFSLRCLLNISVEMINWIIAYLAHDAE